MLRHLINSYRKRKEGYSLQCEQLAEQNKAMPIPVTTSSTHAAISYQKLKDMLAFDKGRLIKSEERNRVIGLPNSMGSHSLAVVSLPYGHNLINLVWQLYSNRQYQFVIALASQNQLPFLTLLAQLDRVKIIGHRELLAKVNANSNPQNNKIVILSCPELHPKTITTGQITSIDDVDYCFSMFDTLLCLKNKLPLYALKARQHECELIAYEQGRVADNSGLAAFIFTQLSSVMSNQPASIYSWQFVAHCTVKHETGRYLKRLNRLESVVRLRSREQTDQTDNIHNIIKQIKGAKAAIKVS